MESNECEEGHKELTGLGNEAQLTGEKKMH